MELSTREFEKERTPRFAKRSWMETKSHEENRKDVVENLGGAHERGRQPVRRRVTTANVLSTRPFRTREVHVRRDCVFPHYLRVPWIYSRRSETNGIAETAVRRVQGGTSTLLDQSGLLKQWWWEAMDDCCNSRNIKIHTQRNSYLRNNFRHSLPWSKNKYSLEQRDFIIQFPQKTRTGFINSA